MSPTTSDSVVHMASDLVDSSQLASELTVDDLRWLTPPGICSEGQVVYVCTEDNALFFIHLVYGNVGFGPTVQTLYRYFHHPTKTNLFRSCHCSASNFKLSADRLSVNCKPISIQLNEAHNEYTFVFDRKGKEHIELRLKLVDRGYKVRQNRASHGSGKDAPYVTHRWLPRCETSGSAQLNGKTYSLKGFGTFIHVFSNMRPYQAADRWNLFTYQSDRAAVNLIHYLPHSRHGSTDIVHDSLVLDGKLLALTSDNNVKVISTREDTDTGYYPPTHLQLSWRGQTLEEQPRSVDISMELRPNILCERVDVLDVLPWVIRKVIQVLVAKPFIYQWFDPVCIRIRLDNEEILDEGHVMYEATFIN
jgi:hypothetical protein